jgi:hypothetical protein
MCTESQESTFSVNQGYGTKKTFLYTYNRHKKKKLLLIAYVHKFGTMSFSNMYVSETNTPYPLFLLRPSPCTTWF